MFPYSTKRRLLPQEDILLPVATVGGRGCGSRDLLKGPLELVILSHPMLSSLLADCMLDHQFFAHFLQELADESGIPELTGNTQVFAASHQRIRFAALSGSGDAIWIKVLLFTTGD